MTVTLFASFFQCAKPFCVRSKGLNRSHLLHCKKIRLDTYTKMMDTFEDEPEGGLRNRSAVVMGGGQSDQANNSGNNRKLEHMELGEEEEEEDRDSFLDLEHGMNAKSLGPRGFLLTLRGHVHSYLGGFIKPKKIGNMQVLFPEYLGTSGWGVLGPQWFGPACVWLILVVASHFCINRAGTLGVASVVLCYIFFGASTYFLTDVSLRDPGICMHKEIPETIPSSERSQWRWCDFCQGYQPPGGAHCPDCNVCIAGYDHHCVWMGTCIGKKNYRQFVRFNVSWLYYLAYVFFWLITFGPLMLHKKP